MAQSYKVITSDAHVMLGNSVNVHCTVPSHLSEWVHVVSWRVEENGQEPLELVSDNYFGTFVLFNKNRNK